MLPVGHEVALVVDRLALLVEHSERDWLLELVVVVAAVAVVAVSAAAGDAVVVGQGAGSELSEVVTAKYG